MLYRYECTEDILGRAMVLSEILQTHIMDLEDHMRDCGVSDEIVDILEALSSEIFEDYDSYMFMVDDIIFSR